MAAEAVVKEKKRKRSSSSKKKSAKDTGKKKKRDEALVFLLGAAAAGMPAREWRFNNRIAVLFQLAHVRTDLSLSSDALIESPF